MFAKMSLRDRLLCFADFVGITLLAWFPYASSLLPMAPFLFSLLLPNCFLRVCLPTLFAVVLKIYLPLTTSASSGTASSNKSPTRFAAGTMYLLKNGIEVLPKTCASVPNACPRYRPRPIKNGISTCLEATIL